MKKDFSMWYTKFGPSGDTVLSSRVRLARNFSDIPFGNCMTDEHQKTVISRCREALPDMKFIDFSQMPPIEKQSLSECHLVSPAMAESQKHCGILVNNDCSSCIMLGEEDHIRIQSMAPGLNLDLCLKVANDLDDRLEQKADYAFHKDFGYLTQCPTNLGTGLRASVMMHLPSLTQSGRIESIIRSLSKLGLAVRGLYGEGSQALGNIYQISNQVTLGVTEEETLEKLNHLIADIIQKERDQSRLLYEQNRISLEDKLMRSFGILTNARLLTSLETINLISDVRWAINLGIITNISLETLSSVFYSVLPATITKNHNISSATERDLKRAEIVKDSLWAE
ncbi:MAG: protein arginine kinase [Clostridia bacterium]|nr:protein arginine kinase [Clostridia bacterium]